MERPTRRIGICHRIDRRVVRGWFRSRDMYRRPRRGSIRRNGTGAGRPRGKCSQGIAPLRLPKHSAFACGRWAAMARGSSAPWPASACGPTEMRAGFLICPGSACSAEFVDLRELTQIGIQVDHRVPNGVKIARDGAKYKTLNWVRPRLVGGRPVWPVEWSEDEHAWIPVDRKKIAAAGVGQFRTAIYPSSPSASWPAS